MTDELETAVTSHSSVAQTRAKNDNEHYCSTRSYSPQNSWREHTRFVSFRGLRYRDFTPNFIQNK